MPYLLLTLPFVSTMTGGLLSLRLRRSVQPLMAMACGLLAGTVLFDLLPESTVLARQAALPLWLPAACAAGLWLALTGIGRSWPALGPAGHAGIRRRRGAAGLLVLHSLRDGLAIGAAFAASPAAGYAVAAGVIAHDLADGINTVVLSTGGGEATAGDYTLLLLDAAAPVAGGMLASRLHFSPAAAAVCIALAAGYFLRLITGTMLPQLRGAELRSRTRLALLAAAGMIVIVCVHGLLRDFH